jgi:O-succinylbenzoic acid--CoA ligase
VLASVAATERRLGAKGRWVLLLPPSYVAGVQVICRSLVAGHPPATIWPDERDEPWFTSLVPTQLRRFLESPDDVAALRTAHTVLLGGGPIDAAVRAQAEDEGLRIVATYGSAETSGGCVYDGLPLDGVAVAIGTEGRIRIAGPTLFDGYDDDRELTAGALVDGWFLSSDAGRLDEDGRLTVFGRMDDMVISGGLNVPAPAVAARLRQHPDITDVEVLGVDDPEWGQRLVAFVVSDLDMDLELLRDWVAAEQPRAWAPRQLVVVGEIPRLDNGKPDRVALRGMA